MFCREKCYSWVISRLREKKKYPERCLKAECCIVDSLLLSLNEVKAGQGFGIDQRQRNILKGGTGTKSQSQQTPSRFTTAMRPWARHEKLCHGTSEWMIVGAFSALTSKNINHIQITLCTHKGTFLLMVQKLIHPHIIYTAVHFSDNEAEKIPNRDT